jgi:hypothetical protein
MHHQLWGCKVEKKLYLGVHEQKMVECQCSREPGDGGRGSLVVKTLGYNPEGSRPHEVKFLIYVILPAAIAPGVYSASNRNKYRKH